MFFMLLGHYLGDFALQSDRMAEGKLISPATLTQHVLVYTVTLGITLAAGLALTGRSIPTAVFGIALAAVFLEHWLQDWLKPKVLNRGKQGLFIDQGLHLIVLFAVRLIAFPG
jgi:hypothetical protein